VTGIEETAIARGREEKREGKIQAPRSPRGAKEEEERQKQGN
jgi:hypothetical protein